MMIQSNYWIQLVLFICLFKGRIIIMENRNNALHYKMYKSGKSIVYAGLATTAALAGLVLANTNATAVHADTAAPATTEQVATNNSSTATSATSAEIAAAQANVNAKSTALSDATVATSTAQSNFDAAAKTNSGVAVVAQDKVAVSDAQDNLSNAVKADQKARLDRTAAQQAYNEASDNAANAGVTASAVAAKSALAASQSDNAASASAQLASATSAVASTLATVQNIKDQINAQSDRIQNVYDKFLQAGGTDAMIEGTQKVPASLQGQLNVYKQLWAGMDSLNASLADANKAHSAALTDKGTYQKQFNFYRLDAKGLAEQAAQGQKMLDKVAAAKAALNAAILNVETAATNRANANAALKSAWSKLDNDRVTYGVPTQTDVANAESEANAASDSAAAALAKTHQNVAGPRYYAASDSVVNNQKALNSASAARPAAVTAVSDAEAQLKSANAALASATAGTAEYATAKKQVAEAQQALDDAQGTLGNLDAVIAHANDEIAKSQKVMAAQLALNNGRLQTLLDEYNAAAAKATAAQKNYETVKANYDNAQKPLASMDAAANALAAAKANQAAAQKAYDQAVKTLNDLTNGNNNGGNTDNNGGNNNGGSTDNNGGNNNGGSTDNNGGNTNSGNGSANTNNGNGSATVNGNHGTAVSGNGVAAANKAVASLAATKASVKGASAAATANDSKSLPQTGNENASAVVALGAVSAMFGLGLAAKKREF